VSQVSARPGDVHGRPEPGDFGAHFARCAIAFGNSTSTKWNPSLHATTAMAGFDTS
jgi:hypothetical protein